MEQGLNNYRVVFEIETDAVSPLAAAKAIEAYLQGTNMASKWQYFVQDVSSLKISSVDLDNEDRDEDVVVDADDYKPLISK